MANANDTACDRTNHENKDSKLDPRATQKPAESIPETMQSDSERWKHSSLRIDTLLEMDDSDLLECCQAHPQGIDGIRRALTEQQTQGREYLVTTMCNNVGSLGDCHGHDKRSDGSEPERPAAPDIDDIDPSGEIYLAFPRVVMEQSYRIGISHPSLRKMDLLFHLSIVRPVYS